MMGRLDFQSRGRNLRSSHPAPVTGPGPTRATSNFPLAPAPTQASPKGEAKNKQIRERQPRLHEPWKPLKAPVLLSPWRAARTNPSFLPWWPRQELETLKQFHLQSLQMNVGLSNGSENRVQSLGASVLGRGSAVVSSICLSVSPPWRILALEALGPETGPKPHILATWETDTR